MVYCGNVIYRTNIFIGRNSSVMPANDQVAVNLLQPHPRNSSIYGEEDVSELVELIRLSQWVRPLVVTLNHVIISGHRRWKAVCLLKWETVAIEYREFSDQLAELEALLLENASRFKTTEQKVREALAWRDIEAYRAKTRQILLAGTRPNSKPDLQENFPEGHRGQSRDRIADRVGLGSGRTYEKATAVVKEIDALREGTPEASKALRQVLNEQSVDAAVRLLKKPAPFRQQILSFIAKGEAKSIKEAERMVKQNSTDFNDPSQLAVPLKSSFRIGDIVFIDIDRQEAVSPQEKKWNSFWVKVVEIGETGAVTVDVGCGLLRLFPRDLKPLDAPSSDLHQVVERVLRLRTYELDEIEERMLDVIQRRGWFTSKQLVHLENIEKLYPATNPCNNHQKAHCRSP